MAILEKQERESASVSTITKLIDNESEDIVFDIMQKTQYQFPIKSTVREIACNAVDGINEKIVARKILTGEAKVSDHFIEREDYPNSKFDPSYYSLKHLSPDNNVYIQYSTNSTDKRDFISIKDFGTGIGGQRLIGYFKLTYSTKRNWAKGIGKYGLGAKAPLSTQISSYRAVMTYNGYRAAFDIYDRSIVPVTPKVDLTTGKINRYFKIEDNQNPENFLEYYAEEVPEEFNSTEIIIPVKKHAKQEYLNAVKSQLMYFNNIHLSINDYGVTKDETVQFPVLFENDDFIINENNIYTRPHLVVNGVNYNDINFQELEIEDKRGNIGIKVNPNEIEITPSRESVIWSPLTRDSILRKFRKVQETASKIIQDSIGSETDYIEWLQKIVAITKRMFSEEDTSKEAIILKRLSSIIDVNDLNIQFNHSENVLKNENTKYGKTTLDLNSLFPGFRFREFSRRWNGHKHVYSKMNVTSLSEVDFNLLYLKLSKSNPKINISIFEQSNIDRFYVMESSYFGVDASLYDDEGNIIVEQFTETAQQSLKYFMKSKYFKDYSKVPILSIAETVTQEEEFEQLTLAERRKLSERINVQILQSQGSFEHFWFNKFSPQIKSLIDYDKQNLFIYGYLEDKELLKEVYNILSGRGDYDLIGQGYDPLTFPSNTYNYSESDYVSRQNNPSVSSAMNTIRNSAIVSLVSKENSKLLNSVGVYVKDLLLQFKNNHLTMSQYLIEWNTSRLIDSLLIKQFKFIYNVGHFNKSLQESINILTDYRSKFKPLGSDKFIDSFKEHADKLLELQLYIQANKGAPALIADKATELFSTDAITKASAVDLEIYNRLIDVIEKLSKVKTIFNDSETLTTDYSLSTLDSDLRKEYEVYCNHVGFELE